MTNPYNQFSAQDSEFLQMALTAVANAAQQQGQEPMYHQAMALIQRVQQYAHAGNGIPKDLMEKFADRFSRAMLEKNNKVMIVTLRDWITTMMRLSPDPAKEISTFLTQMTLSQAGFAQIAQGGTIILQRVAQKVSALRNNYEWEDAETALKFLVEWLAVGQENLTQLNEPWDGDEEVDPIQQ